MLPNCFLRVFTPTECRALDTFSPWRGANRKEKLALSELPSLESRMQEIVTQYKFPDRETEIRAEVEETKWQIKKRQSARISLVFVK